MSSKEPSWKVLYTQSRPASRPGTKGSLPAGEQRGRTPSRAGEASHFTASQGPRPHLPSPHTRWGSWLIYTGIHKRAHTHTHTHTHNTHYPTSQHTHTHTVAPPLTTRIHTHTHTQIQALPFLLHSLPCGTPRCDGMHVAQAQPHLTCTSQITATAARSPAGPLSQAARCLTWSSLSLGY